MLMLVAPVAELVWRAVAGMYADELFVNDSAGNIGSIAPSRRYWRSLGTPLVVVYAFVGEQFDFLEFAFLANSWLARKFIFLERAVSTSWVRSWSTPGTRTPCAGFAAAVGSPSSCGELGAWCGAREAAGCGGSSARAAAAGGHWVARLRGLRGLSISSEGADRPQRRRLALVLGFELRGHFKVF